ncbi:MAG: SpoIIE family protein phosphatase [Deltaproteobacteria bacterium]|nr:SpoIIE family protein phosphatase [Deltaproteobacteria bacterium]
MVIIPISSDIDVFKAKRAGRQTAKDVGFDASECALVEIAISELATNIIKHAVSGTISIDEILDGLEIISEDLGRGIAELEWAIKSGKSAKGLGIGLAGVKRVMDQVEIISGQGRGARIIARKWKVKPEHLLRPKQEYSVPQAGVMKYGVISIPALGSELNGDAYVIKEFDQTALIAVIDGLGHGEKAYVVAQEAADYVQKNYTNDIGLIIEKCHEALRGTRGVVMALARVDFEASQLTTAGVGNIGMKVIGKNLIKPFSVAGIVGHNLRKLIVQEFLYSKGDTIFMYSDGVSDRFDSEEPELTKMKPQEAAEAIVRRFGKDKDDTTIVVAREA